MPHSEQVQKACIACGLQKPLTAFLQISGAQGTTFGNVCATCRGTGEGKKIVLPQTAEEDLGGGTSGLKIDANAKIFADREKLEHVIQEKQEHIDEVERRFDEIDQKEEKKNLKSGDEKRHRQGFIEQTTHILVNKAAEKVAKEKQDKQQNMYDNSNRMDGLRKEATLIHEGQVEENKLKGIEFTEAYTDPVHSGQIKFQSAEFLKVRKWLGQSAGINTIERQIHPTNKANPEQKSTKDKKDPLLDYVQDKWGENSPKPTSRRGR